MGKTYAIPDVHGELALLTGLLEALGRDGFSFENDTLVFLGDYVDRGHDSRGVIKTIQRLTTQYPKNVIALAGNHEWLMIDGLAKMGVHKELWYMNGGHATVKSYQGYDDIESDAKWLASLPLCYGKDGFFFSHAPVPAEGYRRENKGKDYSRQELTWTYHNPEVDIARNEPGFIGVCGHIHQVRDQLYKQEPLAPRFYKHYWFLDAGCGCYPYAPLVAVNCTDRYYLSQNLEDVSRHEIQ